MRRRRLLAALAGLAVGTAGCTGSAGPPARTPTDEGELRIVGESMTTADGSCATDGDAASVAVGDDAVRVDGRLATATPCHGATLAEARLDGSRLVVVVDPTEPTAGACAQCLGVVPYDLTVRFAGGLPTAVRVVHDGETVTTTER
ncbi:MAG: hypothetical protein V5A82_11650 [Haloferacaceae archaeon]